MDRVSSKHSPRLDEQMARNAQGTIQSESGGGRAEEWRAEEAELNVNRLSPGGSAPAGMTAAERDDRSRLGHYLRRSTFPADHNRVLREATAGAAPEDILQTVAALPGGRDFQNVANVWPPRMEPQSRAWSLASRTFPFGRPRKTAIATVGR